jgi:2,4-dienoyl-CoA reductase-like NADH-dependent reductase (Old Yellow Enzyme family)
MRLYEKINSQQVTFSNRIIVAPAKNSQQAKKIFKDFVVVETKYMDFDTLLKD